jgi:prophage antirepressor-like protein
MNDSQPLRWGDIALSQVVYVDGIPHPTGRAIGEWLEYEDPARSISKVLDRNAHIDHYSTVVNLTTVDGKNRDTRVYHPIGFLLIVMESGQPRAQAMKVAVAEFVWHFAGPQEVSPKERNTYIREIERLTDKLAITRDAMVYKQAMQALQHYCRMAAWPLPEVTLLGQDPKQLRLEGV